MLASHPWLLYLALVVLPGFGFPASVLLVLAGVVWGADPLSALTALSAIVINLIWTHFVATGPGRNVIIRLLADRWKRWENLPRNDQLRLAVVLRLTPGIPLCVQNYVLGLLGVPLLLSIATALPLTGLWVFGFVLTGGAVFEGNLGPAIAGLSLLIVAALVAHRLRKMRVVDRRP